MTFYKWSQTASTNGTADSTCPFPEGMSPAAVNDGTRGMMAAAAKFRDDVSGAIVTGGTSTAYTVASYQGFDTLAHLDGKVIAFTPHTTNGANGSSLNIDGLGVKPILTAPGVGLPGGVLVAGTPYAVVYNNTDGAFYLHGFFGNPYNIPIGACIDFFGATAPNSSFVLAYGQAISRTTYSVLFALLGTTYGTGDGSTTFNVPDCRGRVVAGADAMGGVASGRLTDALAGIDSLGDAGGAQTVTLTAAQLPANIPNSATTNVSANGTYHVGSTVDSISPGGPTTFPIGNVVPTYSASTTVTINPSGGGAHANVQPTIIANKLLRII